MTPDDRALLVAFLGGLYLGVLATFALGKFNKWLKRGEQKLATKGVVLIAPDPYPLVSRRWERKDWKS